MERSFQYLGQAEWAALAQLAICADACCCDLRDVRCVYPPGVVALILLARHRAKSGLTTAVRAPLDQDVLNYLERIDALARLNGLVEFDRDLSRLASNRRNPASTFTEVLTPEDPEFENALELIWSHFEREVPAELPLVFSAFEEVFRNIGEHSDPARAGGAFCCVQVQVYEQAIELAFGDLGVGFLATLRANRQLPPLANETAALRGVLLHAYSRHAHENRGGGLRRASDVVARLEGDFRVISRDGVGRRYRGEGHRFSNIPHAFPGTLVWMRIPRPGTEGVDAARPPR